MTKPLFLLPVLALFGLLGTAFGVIAKEPQRIAFYGWQEHYPPYFYQRNGQLTGITVDILKSAFDELGYQVDFRFVPTGRLALNITLGELDCVMQYVIKGQPLIRNVSTFEISSEPLFTTQLQVFARPNSDIGSLNRQQLGSHRMGIIRTPQFGPEQWALMGLEMADRHYYSDFQQVIKALYSERVDLITINPVIIETLLPSMGIAARPKTVHPLNDVDSHLGFSRRSSNIDAKALVKRFDQALIALKARGEVNRIIHRHSPWLRR
jgi:polar amino acid transport system substrate-binding protein